MIPVGNADNDDYMVFTENDLGLGLLEFADFVTTCSMYTNMT